MHIYRNLGEYALPLSTSSHQFKMLYQLLVSGLVFLTLAFAYDDLHSLYCFTHADGRAPTDAWSIDIIQTGRVCDTLSSGKMYGNIWGACTVKSFDVKWFKERCEGKSRFGKKYVPGDRLVPALNE